LLNGRPRRGEARGALLKLASKPKVLQDGKEF
jgi:hypothetical protein